MKAAEGDVEALEQLKLEDDMMISVARVSTKDSQENREEMEQAVDDCVYLLEAATRLEMAHFADIVKKYLAVIRSLF